MAKRRHRLAVQKTYKLFIGGKFVRGENGRVIAARDAQGNVVVNYCRSTKRSRRLGEMESVFTRPNFVSHSGNAGRAPTRVGKRPVIAPIIAAGNSIIALASTENALTSYLFRNYCDQ